MWSVPPLSYWLKTVILISPKKEISCRIHKHWHGATADSWFSHLAIEVPGENYSNEWLESVNDDEYNILK